MIKVIVFDLDDTLYDQKLYVYKAFRKISKFISKKYKRDEQFIYRSLIRMWLRNGPMYQWLFNDLVKELGIESKSLINTLVRIFHSYKSKLRLYPKTRDTLQKLRKKYIIGMITDGNVQMQKNKISALNIKNLFNIIIFCKLKKGFEKPNVNSYRLMIKKIGIKPNEMIYIGDNPYVDFIGAKKIGINTVRILKGFYKNTKVNKKYDADYKIKDLNQIFSIIKKIENT